MVNEKHTFMALYRDGIVDASGIHQFVDACSYDNKDMPTGAAEWAALLGMTPQEYLMWVATGELPERGAP